MKPAAVLKPEVLASIELFLGLSPAALADGMASARLHELAKGSRIFDQGERAERGYALIDGCVRIAQSGSDGAQVVMRFIGPGETFGTVALFTDRYYPAEAVTLTDSLGISWSEAALLGLIERHPALAINLVKMVGRRLQETQDRLRELATLRVERRVAHALLRLAEQAGEGTASGTRIDFRLTRKHVAEISGTTLHTASRILTAWEKAGWIVTYRQRVTLCNSCEIRRIAQG
jgi:CRP/FNR family transcriptional regulator, nitrogen oxide reductase regulator